MSAPKVDWSLATRLGSLLVPAGPQVSPAEAAEVVADLRACAAVAADLVADATRLSARDPGLVLVVDRPGWIAYNSDLASRLLDADPDSSLLDRFSGLLAGAQLGAGLPLVATKVLGQYDPFSDRPTLLLVAPNVVQIARDMRVDGHAFRMWVCLHEVTHRHQFGHAPWLADHLRELLRRLVGAEVSPLAGWRPGRPLPRTMADLLFGADGREALDEVTAVMTLLEGHADVMMDRTDAVPGVAAIRARFQARREATGLDAVIRALTGLDAKQAQYREGARFCRHVIGRVDVAGLNRVFEAPALLPTRAEILDPDLWLARAHPGV